MAKAYEDALVTTGKTPSPKLSQIVEIAEPGARDPDGRRNRALEDLGLEST
jgi:hypothetical protein